MAEAPAVLLVPCGHVVLCAECAALVCSTREALCPLCRTPVASTLAIRL